jgi:four helix bundle protein
VAGSKYHQPFVSATSYELPATSSSSYELRATSHQHFLPATSHQLPAKTHQPITMNEDNSHYKDLQVWQKSMDFANAVIDLTEHLNSPRQHYRLVEQLEAAASSVPMNIAEGKGRYSRKEFAHFLHISRGSLYECMTLLQLFQRRNWITKEALDPLETQANTLARMLNGLINSLEI